MVFFRFYYKQHLTVIYLTEKTYSNRKIEIIVSNIWSVVATMDTRIYKSAILKIFLGTRFGPEPSIRSGFGRAPAVQLYRGKRTSCLPVALERNKLFLSSISHFGITQEDW